MIRETTQKGILNAVYPINIRYKVYHLYLQTSRLTGKWYVDWILVGTKYLAQNAEAFLFSDGTFTKVYPSESKQKMPKNMSLNDFCNYVGIP